MYPLYKTEYSPRPLFPGKFKENVITPMTMTRRVEVVVHNIVCEELPWTSLKRFFTLS